MTTLESFLRAAWKRRSLALGCVCLCALAVAGFYICREAFFTGATGHFNSIRGEWLALARIAGMDWFRPRWWPYWGGGAPLEYVYAPLIPFSIAAVSQVLHSSPELAFNIVMGMVYCGAPLLLFIAVWRLTKSPGFSFIASLAYLVAAPPGEVNPGGALGLAWFGATRQAYRLFDWDDLPHQASLALLPLAVWLLARALWRRRALDYALAGAAMAIMMLASAFGLVLTGIVVITASFGIEKQFRPRLLISSVLVAVAAWLVACPWTPPSLLHTVSSNAAWDGEADWSWRGLLALGILLGAWWLAWRIAKRIQEWPVRWIVLFACPAILIPVLNHYAGLHFLPQPQRYEVEMELALALLLTFGARALVRRMPVRARVALALPLLLLAGRQIAVNRRFVKHMLRSVNVAGSIEYRSAKWIESNLPQQRIVAPGSIATWLNAFSVSPQLSAQPYTTAPNRSQQIAMYTILSGQSLGEHDAGYSIVWMKAFGVHAVAVSGPRSPEYWKPFAHPRKFDGVLPLLWREDDTAIYRLPQASASLAHVMFSDQLVQTPPFDGTYIRELLRYDGALDNPVSEASFRWRDPNGAVIHARLEPSQVVSVQVNFHPGWRAFVNGSPRPIRRDGIGFIAIEPDCSGECEIDLRFDGGREAKLCRVASVGALLLTLAAMIRQLSSRAAQRDR